MTDFWSHFTWFALVDLVAILVAIPVVLATKKGTVSAIAWCLVILFLPLLGSLLFWVFGYTYLHRPLRRKMRHRSEFHRRLPQDGKSASVQTTWKPIADIGRELHEFVPTSGNKLTHYSDTKEALTTIFDAIRAARHHIHLQFYIVRSDQAGKEFIALLTEKAKQGVAVRLLYDSLGGFFFCRKSVKNLIALGGEVVPFLPLNLFRSRLRVNLRNHRKIVVIDGEVAFTGGMNIGDEYLGRSKHFSYWRDQMIRIEGPAVEDMQRIFIEDWDFTTGKMLLGEEYFPSQNRVGNSIVQILASGPDQETNCLREIFFAAFCSAQKRIWMATPYFIPDRGLLDALRFARHRDVEIRLLMPARPDHLSTFYASRYFFSDLLHVGVQVYLYQKGMMHSKIMILDGEISIISSANLDQRSLSLNFEAGCAIFSPEEATKLEAIFLDDLLHSDQVDPSQFAMRSYASRLAENALRLFSPIL